MKFITRRRVLVGVVLGQAEVAKHDGRLRHLLGNHLQQPLRCRRQRGERRGGNGLPRPVAEALLEQGEQFRLADVAGDRQPQVVRRKVLTMESLQLRRG